MVRVVIDANSLISAILSHRGNSARILNLFREDYIEVAISKEILEEIERVLHYPKIRKRHGWNSEQIRLFLKEFERFCVIVSPAIRNSFILEKDPSDDKYILCAIASQVDYIVTGDKALLKLGQYEGVQIVSPKEFLEVEKF